MEFQNLKVEDRGDGLTRVTVNRPDVLNALNDKTMGELHCCFESLGSSDSVRLVVLTGAGEKAFVAGADIKELAEQGPLDGKARSKRGQAAFQAIESLGKPVLGAINGFALGGGLELALACHVRYASSRAKLGLPEVKLGIIPGYGGTQRLSRLVGLGNALHYTLTGDMIDAAEAQRLGLVTQVFEPETLVEEVEKIGRRILERGPLAVSAVLEAALRGLESPLSEGLALEADLFGLMSTTHDMREGMAAFLDKRDAEFKGA